MTETTTETTIASEATRPGNREIAIEHGLTGQEYDDIVAHMCRVPNVTELGIFSAMWSEHCSYKSSRKWLATLPTKAPWVIQGPGENAGVIDIGDGQAAIFKMESHNHPSYIEPYQGAATGVGGILRDVFTMGARPVANLNCLRFGSPEHPKTRHLVAGVVAGIGGYGNCIGVPTVGGECSFDARYDGNILVNAMTVGLADADRIFYSAASGPGSPVVYVGSKTGRDGIHGASMASAAFGDDIEEKRPTVQVGDPFTEKLLVEACLELMATDAIIGIQDMGAAGLTSSSIEMADKGGAGIRLDLDRVPIRETVMTPYEIMLSESQERMLMVLKPGAEDRAREIFEKWELDFAVIGQVTDSGRIELTWHGDTVADMPVSPLAEGVKYDRPWSEPVAPPPLPSLPDHDSRDALLTLLSGPDLGSREWIWDQYDHMVMGDTVQRPGGDAAVVRVHGTRKGLAMTADCTPRYCEADPVTGGRQAVAEAWRNLSAVGARPLAITDCLNFGNPEREPVMGQFVKALEGMAEACTALDFPVVSGNVSFYNETEGRNIPPTPQVGGVGLIDDIDRMATPDLPGPDHSLVLVGTSAGHLGQSLYARSLLSEDLGPPPPVDLALERRNGDFVRGLIASGRVTCCHDVSDGGLYVAAAEMAIAGAVGVDLYLPDDAGTLFGEDQARYVVAIPHSESSALLEAAAAAGVIATCIGRTTDDGAIALTRNGANAISVDELRAAQHRWLPAYMSKVEN
jgi:phosphoribosylformylglycinamidine synthase